MRLPRFAPGSSFSYRIRRGGDGSSAAAASHTGDGIGVECVASI